MRFSVRVIPIFAGFLMTGELVAQSSQFGARGLGLPLRPLSVRATATGSAFGLFDSESALNPASFAMVGRFNATFQTVQGWRRSESPAGSGTARDNRFPGIFIAGSVGGTPLAVALSASGYTDRNFVLVSEDTVIPRDVPVGVVDSLASEGGITDIRAAVAWRQSNKLQFGLGLHLLTGSNRIKSHRIFSDTAYAGVSENNTISYLGVGASLGVMARFGKALTLGGIFRMDDHLHVERDTTHFGNTKLPITVSGGARLQLGERLQLAGNVLFRNWSVANDDIIAQQGIGSSNTTEFAGGAEYITNKRRPFQRPIRLGFFHGTLPFPLRVGEEADETGISIGSAIRFAADRAGFDFALSQVWRRGAPGFTERATLLNLGVSLRP